VIDEKVMSSLAGFRKRVDWFLAYRSDLAPTISYLQRDGAGESCRRYLLAIPSRQRLLRVLRYLLDENEFLSPFGIRSLSKYHEKNPLVCRASGQEFRVQYLPGESDSNLFGGNSNWRGPIWFPLNYLIIEALQTYYDFYGDELAVEFPTGSGRLMNLKQIALELAARLTRLFDPERHAPEQGPPGGDGRLLFYEHFDGDTGRGLGASHQTGWTALVA
jgi:hypothetical protein